MKQRLTHHACHKTAYNAIFKIHKKQNTWHKFEHQTQNSNVEDKIQIKKTKQNWIRTSVTDKFERNWVEFSCSISRRIPYVWTSGWIERFPFALSRPNGKATNSLTFIGDAILQSPFAIGFVLELVKCSLARSFRLFICIFI